MAKNGRGGKGLPRAAVSNKKAIFKNKRLLARHSRRKAETRLFVAMEIRSQTRYLRPGVGNLFMLEGRINLAVIK
jgi:hypothetical protein